MAAVSPATAATAAGASVVATAAGRSTLAAAAAGSVAAGRSAAADGSRPGGFGRRGAGGFEVRRRRRLARRCRGPGSGGRLRWLRGGRRGRGSRGGCARVGRGLRRSRQMGRRDRHDGHRRRTGRRVEEGELELEAEAADAAPLRVDRGEAMGGSGQRAGPGGVARVERLAERDAELVDDLVEHHGHVPAALVERVEGGDPGGRSTVDQGRDQLVDRIGVGEAEEIADGRLVDGRPAGGEDLVEHRLRVAHAAGGQPGDEVDGTRLGVDALRREDPPELPLDLLDREAADVVALETRQDRRRELLGMGRGEDEDDEVRRLLERLQERVPGVLRDLVGLVEDVDLPSQVRRGVVDPVAELPDVRDAAVARGVDLDEVHRPALADRDARLAPVARVAVLEVRAVDGLGEDPGERRLARPARADEEDRVGDPAGADGVPQRLDDGGLPDDLAEGLRPPPAVERLVRRRRRGRGERRGREDGVRGRGGRGLGRRLWSSRAHGAPVEGLRRPAAGGRINCRAPTVVLWCLAPVATSGSDQAVPRHPTMIA